MGNSNLEALASLATIILIDAIAWIVAYKVQKEKDKTFKQIYANLAVIGINVSIYALLIIVNAGKI